MEGNSINTFENLCRIFEMRIKINNAKGESTPSDVIDDYEKYAQKIDSYYNTEFQRELKELISPKSDLEEEKERLESLIKLLEGRLEKRSSLADNFYRITGKYMKNLQLIVSDGELNNKKNRLEVITRYLDTVKEIEELKENIEKLKDSLEEEKNHKEEYEEKNKLLEDEIYSAFITSIEDDEYYGQIEEKNLFDILKEVSKKSREAKETLDITKDSVESLLSNGMDDEYSSYVEEASKNYYLWKEREIILEIYKLVINFEESFEAILNKRKEITALLDERKGLISDKEDILVHFEDVKSNQDDILNTEKDILDSITNYNSRIDFKEERLTELDKVLKEPEILAILSEYDMLPDESEDSSDNSSFNIPTIEDNKEETIEIKEYNPYMITSIDSAPISLNVGLAKLKGASVRDKVNKKLNPSPIPSIEENNINNIPNLEDTNPNLDTNLVDNNEETTPNQVSDAFSNESENTPTNDLPSYNQSLEEANTNNDSLEETTTPSVGIPISNIPVTESTSDVDLPDPMVLNEIPMGAVPIQENINNDLNNNQFWTPVSESKASPDDFPNINVPFTPHNLNEGADNFGFPGMNENKGEE